MEAMVKKAAQALLNRASTINSVAPRAIARALFLNDETFATVLFLMVVDTYPDVDENGRLAVFNWHPKTIKMQIEQDFSLQLPDVNLDKIQAIITILTTNYFYKSADRFIKLCNVLAGDDFRPDEFEPADAGEILWGLTEAMLWCPPDDDPDDTEFSPDVLAYIRNVLREEGIAHPPDILRLGVDPHAAVKIDEAFDDDPEMLSAVWKAQQSKSDDLTEMLKSNLSELAQQLQLLPIDNGSTKQVVAQVLKMAGHLPAAEEAPISI